MFRKPGIVTKWYIGQFLDGKCITLNYTLKTLNSNNCFDANTQILWCANSENLFSFLLTPDFETDTLEETKSEEIFKLSEKYQKTIPVAKKVAVMIDHSAICEFINAQRSVVPKVRTKIESRHENPESFKRSVIFNGFGRD